MESISYNNIEISLDTIEQMIEGCRLILVWNAEVSSIENYGETPSGFKNLAATSMVIEAIGEGVKNIDKRLPGFFEKEKPDIPWRKVKGMRDRIAQGYFNIDAVYVFSIVKTYISPLRDALVDLKEILEGMEADCHSNQESAPV